MKIQEHKPEGVFERELTDAEVDALAARGNIEAKKEKYKKAKPATIEARLAAIEDILGL